MVLNIFITLARERAFKEVEDKQNHSVWAKPCGRLSDWRQDEECIKELPQHANFNPKKGGMNYGRTCEHVGPI
jgi:hypothetical protein